MAAHEGVAPSRITLYLEEKLVENYETPGSINLSIADIIGNYFALPFDDMKFYCQ